MASSSGGLATAGSHAPDPAPTSQRERVGMTWDRAQLHPVVRDGLAEARKKRGKEDRRYIYAVHPGFLLECIRHGERVPVDTFNLELVVAPHVWNFFAEKPKEEQHTTNF